MQSLIVEPQPHIRMLLKVERVPPFASKAIGPRQSRKFDLRYNNWATRTELGHCCCKNLPVSRKLIMSKPRLRSVLLYGYVQGGDATLHTHQRAVVPYRLIVPIAPNRVTRAFIEPILAVRQD